MSLYKYVRGYPGRVLHLLLFLALAGSLQALDPLGRESITFILGQDEDPKLPMYRLAEAHFARDPTERTDRVISSARSLTEIREILASGPKASGPWGIVNFVVHAGSDGTLDLPVVRGGSTLSRENLEVLARGFQPLPDRLLDEASEIRIHGCSAGQDEYLLRQLSRLLGGPDPRRPLVRASRYFTCFEGGEGGVPIRYLSRSWDLIHAASEEPSVQELAGRFQQLHGETGFEVVEALGRRSPRFPGDSFRVDASYRFHWTLVLPRGSAPQGLASPLRLRVWLNLQENLKCQLRVRGLSLDHFTWEAQAIRVMHRNTECAAVKVLGRARVIHVLQSMEGIERAWENPEVYAAAR